MVTYIMYTPVLINAHPLVQVVNVKGYGHSDRRGAINKSTKVFTRQELREMLKKIKDESPEQSIPPLLTVLNEGIKL